MRLKNRDRILTEKGRVQTEVRETLMKKFAQAPKDFLEKATCVGKGKYEVPVHNANNTEVVYIRFEVSVSERSLTSLAQKKATKPQASKPEDIEID